MNDRWLRSFIAVAQARSISGAAKDLFLTPQAIWQHVKHLEGETGLRLFIRTHGGVSLTETGESFYQMATTIVDEYDACLSRCRVLQAAMPRTRGLRIPIAMGIPLSTFWQRLYDKMRLGGGISTSGGATFILEFVGMHDISDSKLEGLRKDSFDLIDYHSRDGVCPAGPFYFEEIGFDHSSVVVDCSDPLANRTFILPEDLIGRRVCTFMPADVSPLKEWAAKHGESIEVSPISCDLVAIMSTCKEGMPVIVESEASLPLEAVMELPLNFDFGMRRGLVCREEDAVSLAPIFALAHEVMSGTENEHRAKVQPCQDATRCSH